VRKYLNPQIRNQNSRAAGCRGTDTKANINMQTTNTHTHTQRDEGLISRLWFIWREDFGCSGFGTRGSRVTDCTFRCILTSEILFICGGLANPFFLERSLPANDWFACLAKQISDIMWYGKYLKGGGESIFAWFVYRVNSGLHYGMQTTVVWLAKLIKLRSFKYIIHIWHKYFEAWLRI